MNKYLKISLKVVAGVVGMYALWIACYAVSGFYDASVLISHHQDKVANRSAANN